MLFEGLVNRPTGGLPTTAQRVRSSRDAIGGISVLSSSAESRSSVIAGAVLVSSKVLRALALLAAYKALASGLSSVVFALSTLGLASVGLIVLQRPWSGKKLSARSFIHLGVQGVLLGSSCVLWGSGLLLCGPATTVMLEYAEVLLLRVGRRLFASPPSSGGPAAGRWLPVARSLLLFCAGVAVMAWGRTEGSRVARRLRELEVARAVTMEVMHSLEGQEAQGLDVGQHRLDVGQGAGGGAAWGAGGRREGGKVSEVVLHELVLSGLDASVQLDNGREEEEGEGEEEEERERQRQMQQEARAPAQHTDGAKPFEFGARTVTEFASGVGLHAMAALLSALRKQQLHSTCKLVGGPKRFFALACPLAVLLLLLLAAYAHLSGRGQWVTEGGMRGAAEGAGGGVGVGGWGSHGKGTVGGSWRELLQFASMGLLVPFYAGAYADRRLPGAECARIGLVSSAAAVLCSWAVRMSPAELSSGVVAVTVLFLVLSIGDEVGDDSVPVGVYSVPGLSTGGFKALQAASRALLRQLLADRHATRLAAALILHLLLLLPQLVYGVVWRELSAVEGALARAAPLLALALGLYGALMLTWRPSPAFTYGYGRFDSLAALANAVLLLLLSAAAALRAAHRLWAGGEAGGGEGSVLLACGSLGVSLLSVACISSAPPLSPSLAPSGAVCR